MFNCGLRVSRRAYIPEKIYRMSEASKENYEQTLYTLYIEVQMNYLASINHERLRIATKMSRIVIRAYLRERVVTLGFSMIMGCLKMRALVHYQNAGRMLLWYLSTNIISSRFAIYISCG